jgi:DNA-binding response OmpR family regulator
MRILVVEDDARLQRNITALLVRDYYAVDMAGTAEEALFKGLGEDYDCILLDWMLPDKSGVAVLRELRKQGVEAPVIMLTARSMPDEVVTGLNAGADDYIVKPFEAEILLARVRAAIRRKTKTLEATKIMLGSLVMDGSSREVRVGEQVLQLTPKEYALLEYLLHHKNQTVSRETLIDHVWDDRVNLFSNSVDVYIAHLRKKLRTYELDRMIKTIPGLGYRLCSD